LPKNDKKDLESGDFIDRRMNREIRAVPVSRPDPLLDEMCVSKHQFGKIAFYSFLGKCGCTFFKIVDIGPCVK